MLPLSVFCLLVIVVWVLARPVNIQAQESPTSTPDAEGNIYVVVQSNDSLWSIAARAGLSLPELLDLNGIEENAVLQPGDLLLIAGQARLEKTPETANSATKDAGFLPRRCYVSLEKGLRIKQAIKGQWSAVEMSPFLGDDLD